MVNLPIQTPNLHILFQALLYDPGILSPPKISSKISMLFSTPRGGLFSRAPPFVKGRESHVHPFAWIRPSSVTRVSLGPLTYGASACPLNRFTTHFLKRKV